uniref:Caspase family p20 domain-containing protein n=2 Tax=Magallana gigas TaxID=29159 RepID=A0A8W8ISU7_MAGGI|nr:uncharacterized protein LOC105325615 [Crassostrea gigas]
MEFMDVDHVPEQKQSTYCNIMEGRPCRAACFDWDFREVAFTGPAKREGIYYERQKFMTMVKELNFTIYPSEKEVRVTRSLPKRNFIKELKKFKNLCVSEPCGCILLSISSHGVIVKTDDQIDSGDFETFEDFILTHPELDQNEFSKNYVDERVSVKEIMEMFRDERLKKIPKIFFIQACRNQMHPADLDADIGFDVCVVRDNGEGEPLPQNHLLVPQASPGKNMAYSPPYLENSVIVFSTPFGYVAGVESTKLGSHVWDVLEDTLKSMVPVNGSINLLDWLKKTNGELAKDENFEIQRNVKYKPLLSISHTLTKQILFKLQRE